MKAFIIHYPFGVVAFDEKDSLIEKVLFSKKPLAAAKSLFKIESGKASDEILSLISLLGTGGVEVFVFENASIAEEVQKKAGVRVALASSAEAESLRGKMSAVARLIEFVGDESELALWNRSVSMELAKLRIKGASEKRDLIVGQAIQTLDDLDRTVNLFMARLREWYGIYFPEMDRLIEKHETFARLVLNLGVREHYTFDSVVAEGLPKERSELVAKTAQSSMGADISEDDLKQIQSLSRDVLRLYELRKNMESYVDCTMEELAPNVKAVAGALLGARLIAMAGGLQNLAMRPASTIQVLGAEKALFRSLKTGARPPKHGLIFQHTLLHDAKRWQRGKIARVIAGKLSIAARADAFGGDFVGERLKAEVNRRLEEIHEKYRDAPPPKESKPREEKRDGEQRFSRDRRRDRFGGGGGGRGGGGRRDRFGGGGGGSSGSEGGGGDSGRRDRDYRGENSPNNNSSHSNDGGNSSSGGGGGGRNRDYRNENNPSNSGSGGSGKFRKDNNNSSSSSSNDDKFRSSNDGGSGKFRKDNKNSSNDDKFRSSNDGGSGKFRKDNNNSSSSSSSNDDKFHQNNNNNNNKNSNSGSGGGSSSRSSGGHRDRNHGDKRRRNE